MSDQERNRGHHIITAHAVKELFQAIPSEKLLGLSPHEFFHKLDAAQAHADRSPAGALLEFKPLFGKPADVSPFGIGDTWMSSRDAPNAQMRHAVANPEWDPQTNLAFMKLFIVGELIAAKSAHDRGDSNAQWRHLGAAVHCLEDSYSSAHIFRDPEHPGDPAAAIKGINNFTWSSETRTHDGAFDQVPVVAADLSLARSSDQAAASAVREIITVFVQLVDSTDAASIRQAFEEKADKFFYGPDAVVLDHRDEAWADQRSAHFANEVSLGTATPAHLEPNSTDAVIMSLPVDGAAEPAQRDAHIPLGAAALNDAQVLIPDASDALASGAHPASHHGNPVHTPTDANFMNAQGHANYIEPHSTTAFPPDSVSATHTPDPHTVHTQDRPSIDSTPADANYIATSGQAVHVDPDSAQAAPAHDASDTVPIDPQQSHVNPQSLNADPHPVHVDAPVPGGSAPIEPVHPSHDVDPAHLQ